MIAKHKFKILPELSDADYNRFWSKVDIRGEDECWPWTAGLIHNYGCFWIGGNYYIATRIAFCCTYGADPLWLFVCHRCDNPPCCNPDHFFLGTNLDNIRDAAIKGRMKEGQRIRHERNPEAARKRIEDFTKLGEMNHLSKLTDAIVLQIRNRVANGEKCPSVARSYGVTPENVRYIVKRKTWRHI